LAEDPRRHRGREAASDQGPRRAAPEGRRQGRRACARAHPGAEEGVEEAARAARAAGQVVMTALNDELLRQGSREAPEPPTAEERSSLSRKTGIAIGGAAIGAALARWVIDATAAHALGERVGLALAGVLAALIVGDAVHRAWLGALRRWM